MSDLPGLEGSLDERRRLNTQRATVSRLIDEVCRGRAMVPADSGGFWHSDAQRAYAAQLQQLSAQLVRGQLSLQDALASIDSALARLTIG